uniref:Uncharacterized protein n=1 Tax=Glossina pallidipes TaxID=7398 RepID=A0A1A9ZKK0_GLOPL
MTNATNGKAIITFTHINQRKNVKYDATPEPKCDSISLMRNSHVPYDWMCVCRVWFKTSTTFVLAMLALTVFYRAIFEPLLALIKTMEGCWVLFEYHQLRTCFKSSEL